MSEEEIIRFCAPTLAGLKAGSLFASMFSGKEELYREVRNLNRRLANRGVRILPLRFKENCKTGGPTERVAGISP